MKKLRILKLHPIVFLCLITALGGIGGGLMELLSPYIPFGAWELAITPPSKAVRLLAYRYPQIFIQTEDNHIFACQEPLPHWQMVEPSRAPQPSACVQASQPQNTTYKNPFCQAPNPLTPLAPEKVIDTLAVRDCGPDGYVDTHFIMLDDGTVWWWNNFQGGYGVETVLFTEVGFGALVGAITGIVLVLGTYLWTRVRR